MNKVLLIILSILLLCGCNNNIEVSQAEQTPTYIKEIKRFSESDCESKPNPIQNQNKSYINTVVSQAVTSLNAEESNDFDKVKSAYEYIIINTSFAEPVGLDIWRIRGNDQALSYIENRALSPLAFGIGSCEDFAAALTLMLRKMGFEAEYVPGLTISIAGDFVDHAWAAVKINGVWYHLDPQLEDNITRDSRLKYRYFLKSDEEMFADHRWGNNLIKYAKLTKQQIHEIESDFILEPCPQSFSQQTPKKIQKALRPNRDELAFKLKQEVEHYEKQNGKLPSITLNVTPPVFGNDGYGDPRY